MPASILFKNGVGLPAALLHREPALDATPGAPIFRIGVGGTPIQFSAPQFETWLYNQVAEIVTANGQTINLTDFDQLLNSIAVFTAKGNIMIKIAEPAPINAASFEGGILIGYYLAANAYATKLYYDNSSIPYRLTDTDIPKSLMQYNDDWLFLIGDLGVIDSIVVLRQAMKITPKNHLLVGIVPEPFDIATADLGGLGGWIFGWGITAHNKYFNGYFDGTGFRHHRNGFVAGIVGDPNPPTPAWRFVIHASGLAGNPIVPIPTGAMTMDPAGNVFINGRMNSANTPLDLQEQLNSFKQRLATLQAKVA